jgi:catechol 2,3-dioxygenase-like lactoylglutathione lyase family enzyme
VRIDHVVLWVEDPLRSVAFFGEVLGCEGVRVDAFRDGKVPFPSIRIAGDQIIDLMPRTMAPVIEKIPGAAGTAGHKANHVCLAMTKDEWAAVKARVEARGGHMHVAKESFGAQGAAVETFYFADPDGNILEARYY